MFHRPVGMEVYQIKIRRGHSCTLLFFWFMMFHHQNEMLSFSKDLIKKDKSADHTVSHDDTLNEQYPGESVSHRDLGGVASAVWLQTV